jgi:hypothetical protein
LQVDQNCEEVEEIKEVKRDTSEEVEMAEYNIFNFMHFRIPDPGSISLPELVTYLGNFLADKNNMHRHQNTELTLQQKDTLYKVINKVCGRYLQKKVAHSGITVPEITLNSNHTEHPDILATFKDARCKVDIGQLIQQCESGQMQPMFLTPKFLELVDSIQNIEEERQLGFVVKFRFALVHVRIQQYTCQPRDQIYLCEEAGKSMPVFYAFQGESSL